ncbi:hypothetical protein [Glutamicibacter sp. PS]|uniref:hypothetical protein n=1 Tax=Glutamicibacter sp. PS TaxID=3075634 RepID=UPI00284012C4|nr:hypothetical protein [Glutamicibacter sp. PS]MDR4533266.1 hypothetical protein [Glutamicibacter sp. PS]
MSDRTDDSRPIDQPNNDQPRRSGKRTVILTITLIVVAALLYFVAAVFLPVWWAQRIASQNAGSATGGWMAGFSLGLIFTLVPLIVAFQAHYKRLTWKWRIAIFILALIAATPNWLTLGIFVNPTGSADKAQQILTMGATWFGGASLFGAALGAVLFLIGIAGWALWHRRGTKIKELKAEQRSHETRAED